MGNNFPTAMIVGLCMLSGLPIRAQDNAPAPVNPYAGMQQREEVFEFAAKPAVKKEGDKWVITFASKAACDATVAIADKDGKIVRHLASGVLGKNAPWPFQQNALAQKIEWDGADDLGRAVDGQALKACKVRVSLGLKAAFERNIGWDPYVSFPGTARADDKSKQPNQYMVAKGTGGELYVLGYWDNTGGTYQGRLFKDGKYVRTFWPPSAKDLDKLPQLGYSVVQTTWGDKVWVNEGPASGRYGTLTLRPVKSRAAKTIEEQTREIFDLIGVSGQKLGPWPLDPAASTTDPTFSGYFFNGKYDRMAVDRARDELYISATPPLKLRRVDGKTGAVDKSWFPNDDLDKVTEVCVGPDDLVYISTGSLGYGQFVTRLTRDGKPVDFAGDAVPLPKASKWEGGGGQYGEMEGKEIYGGRVCPMALKSAGPIKSLWTGLYSHSSVQELGMYVAASGNIVHGVAHPAPSFFKYGESKSIPSGVRSTDKVTSCVVVWDNSGKLLTTAAVGDTLYSHGVVADRDGNIYASYFGVVPADQKTLFGLNSAVGRWGGIGSLVKFRGGPFPLGGVAGAPGPSAPAVRGAKNVGAIQGALWIYGSMTGHASFGCTCHNVRYDMDYFGRPWVMAHHLYSILVLDANGNVVARLGRYGNVDDTEEDVKAGGDGLRFVWPRALAVSEAALYVSDHNARRILKAAIRYAAEESAALP